MTAPFRRSSIVAAFAAALLLPGCATYHADPLPERTDLQSNLSGLSIAASAMPLPELRTHVVEIGKPLDMDSVAMIAVARNPALRAARSRAHIARAEAFSAGLLPNPQFSGDYGLVSSGPGTIASFTLGLMQDVSPFLTLSSRKDAASAQVRGADLDLLWQEWQVVSQARLLVVQLVESDKQRRLIDANRQLFRERYSASKTAMDRGDQTLPNLVSDLTALNSIETQLHDIDQQILSARLDLNALLGLTAEVSLDLAVTLDLPPLDREQLRAQLPDLVKRRPDLLALQAGYQAQEEVVFQAVLNQFPALSIGGNRASDTSNVKTNTASLSIALPLFNHNQGVIAVEKATRETLKLDYQARLDDAYGGVAQSLAQIDQLTEQLNSCSDSLLVLSAAARDADRAFRGGNVDERSFADLQAALLARSSEALRLEQAIFEQRITLLTLIGTVVPDAKETDQ